MEQIAFECGEPNGPGGKMIIIYRAKWLGMNSEVFTETSGFWEKKWERSRLSTFPKVTK